MTTAVKIDNVSIVFGKSPDQALPLMDKGLDRATVQEKCGQVLGVHDCNLEIQEGEILVLMGLSGSGKSTLLRGINGLNPVVRGAVHIRDNGTLINVTDASPADLRRIRRERLAMVFQQFGLLPWRTVAENVGLGLELGGMPKKDRRAKVLEQLDLVGLADWADNKVGEISGGMQQRVGLARAFATDAPILLMDEPFSALDPLIRTKLQDELLELQARLKRTIIFVSHDLDEAFKLGNRIAIMEGGRIVQCGTPNEIAGNPENDYVAEFVAHSNPLTFLRARDVMQADGTTGDIGQEVGADTPVLDFAAAMSAEGKPVAVTENGARIGTVTPESLLASLLR